VTATIAGAAGGGLAAAATRADADDAGVTPRVVPADDPVVNRTYGPRGGAVEVVERHPGGGLVVGVSDLPVQGDPRGWVARTARDGDPAWNRSVDVGGDLSRVDVVDVAVTDDGDVVAVGSALSLSGNYTGVLYRFDADGTEELRRTDAGFDPAAVVPGPGAYYVVGTDRTGADGTAQVRRVATDGSPDWLRDVSVHGERVRAASATARDGGGVVVASESRTAEAVHVTALTADGTETWNRTYYEGDGDVRLPTVLANESGYLFSYAVQFAPPANVTLLHLGADGRVTRPVTTELATADGNYYLERSGGGIAFAGQYFADPRTGNFDGVYGTLTLDGAAAARRYNVSGESVEFYLDVAQTPNRTYVGGQVAARPFLQGYEWTGTVDPAPGAGTDAPFPDGVPGVGSAAPTDPDGDGRYEDVDGDGVATFEDAVALAFADLAAVEADDAGRAALDFDDDGDVDFDDAVALAFAV
jgi:hypothetical protein